MFANKKLFSVACLSSVLAFSYQAEAYETTTFSVALSDVSKTGTMSLGNSTLGNGTTSITSGGNSFNYVYQYFTPVSTGDYVFGQLSSPADSVVLVYQNSFDPNAPGTNFLSMNDDGNPGSISDATLRSYVTSEISGRSCGGIAGLCPLLSASLTQGVDYYIVVSTYSPGDSLGLSSESVSFFVIGEDSVGVGGEPPAGGYKTTVAGEETFKLAEYFDNNDGSGDLATVATYLNSASANEVREAMKEIFPVNSSITSQVLYGATGQTSDVLVDKVGTVLGNINSPALLSLNGTFRTADWMFGSESIAEHTTSKLGFSDTSGYATSGADGLITALSSTPYKRFESGQGAFWVQGVGSATRGDDGQLTSEYSIRTAGVVSGYEFALGKNALLGVIGSTFRSGVEMDSSYGQTQANIHSMGFYGQRLLESIKFTGVFLTSFGKYENERFVNVVGITGRPQADYDGWGTSTTLNVSKLLEHKGYKIEPFASANYSSGSTNGYTEYNGGSFNMAVSADNNSSTELKAGFTVASETWLLGKRLSWKAKPYAGYQWEVEESGNAVSLAGNASSVFVDGRDMDSEEAGFATEATIEVSQKRSFKIGLDVSKNQYETTGIAYIGYGYKF